MARLFSAVEKSVKGSLRNAGRETVELMETSESILGWKVLEPSCGDGRLSWCGYLVSSYFGPSVRCSVDLDMTAVRSSLSQLKLLPSMARLTVRKRTQEKSWR